jgi:type I site-specific restriction endonuclease
LKATDRFAKTIVFCVDQEHADEMRRLLSNLNADLVRDYPDYVCRVTADEGNIGRGHLSTFQDLGTATPVILTTSQLLTTGVDAPMVKNIALVRVVSSIGEFKQIIGRGTRVKDDYGKYFFTILDYTGSATRHVADPFDLLCHVAFNAPLRTRRERADRLRQDKRDFFDQFGPEARSVLQDLLDKYAEYGLAQFKIRRC